MQTRQRKAHVNNATIQSAATQPGSDRRPLRQGDVLIIPVQSEAIADSHALPHQVLAQGEKTGHKHQITEGTAELLVKDDQLYLRVLSPEARLTHEEHEPIAIPEGTWLVRQQREYRPQSWKTVVD